jgi:hypothetical protein
LLRASFRPKGQIAELRAYVRHRRDRYADHSRNPRRRM